MNLSKKTLVQLLIDSLKKHDNMHDILFTKKNDTYTGISRFELVNYVLCLKNYLESLNLSSDSKIAIIAENSVEWVITDFTAMLSSYISVPIYPSLSAESVKYIMKDSKAEVCLVSTTLQLNKILSVRNELPDLKFIISYNDAGRSSETEHIISFQNIFKNKKSRKLNEIIEEVEILSDRINEDDLLTIIYTSGTTGTPKGVMLTHKNIFSNIVAFPEILDVSEKDVFLSYLPYSHIYERTVGYYLAFFSGSKIYYAQSIDTIGVQLQEAKPTLVATVPRLLDRMYNRLMKSGEEMPDGIRKRLFLWGLDVARYHGRDKNTIRWKVADKLVFQKIRAKTGGRIRLFVSGGGALNKKIGEFFDGIGIVTIEGYGLTETSPVVSANRPWNNRYGTIGHPVSGVDVKIADDGEILVKGDIVMKGYYNSPDETAEVIRDGWFHTGDIGEFDSDGFLKITDRKKSLFKSSGGKYIAPTHIEELVSQLRYIDQIIIIGNERMYVTALIVPDRDELKNLARKNNIQIEVENDLFTNNELRKVIEKDINEVQKDLSSFEKIRKFTLLRNPFTIESGELTPSLKIKRKFVEDKYKDLIEMMYHKV